MAKAANYVNFFMNPLKKASMILQCPVMEPDKREDILHHKVTHLCPQLQERSWTVKSCPKNADSVFNGEGKRDLQNFMSGGKAINANARQILQGLQGQWMLIALSTLLKGL